MSAHGPPGAGHARRGDPGRRTAGRGSRRAGRGGQARRASGARLAWVPRRAGERGAVEAGALPGLLPVGRPVADPAARAEVARGWGKSSLPTEPGRDTARCSPRPRRASSAAARRGRRPGGPARPGAALRAIEMTPFVVSLELRASAVTDRADVVFPVAAAAEKAGTFVNWEGRGGSFDLALPRPRGPHRPVRARRYRRRDGRPPRPARCGRGARRARVARRLARRAGRPPRPAVTAGAQSRWSRPGRPCWPPGGSC